MNSRLCLRAGCPRPAEVRGLCKSHYNQARNTGQLTSGWVPATPTVRHIRTLARRGWSTRRIALTAGVAPNTVRMIRRRQRKHVQSWVADAIATVAGAPPQQQHREAA